jgi:hypothetical protein
MIKNTLREIPLAPMPKDITAGVIKHIQTEPVPRFRLSWADFGLSLIITVCIFAVWFGLQNLPPLAFLKLRIQGILLWQKLIVNAYWLFPSISISVGAGLAFLVLINLRQTRQA